MTIAGDLNVILERHGVPKDKTPACLDDIFAFLFDGNVVSFLLFNDVDTTNFFHGLSEIKNKVT